MTITPRQWADAGRTRAELRTELANNRVMRLRRGVYRAASEPTKLDLHRYRMGAALPSLGPMTYFAHNSAAVAHKLPLLSRRLDEVVVVRTGGGHGDITATLHARVGKVMPDDVETVGGLPVTSLARTVADLVRALPFPEAVMVADAGLRRGLSRDRLLGLTATGRGCRMARRALPFADARAESAGESLSRARMEQAGLPAPELQKELYDARGHLIGRVDFWWEEFGIVGEFDGAAKYGALLRPGQTASDVIMEEKRREQALVDAGYLVIRWVWRDLWDHGFEDRLRRAMDARRPRDRPRRTDRPPPCTDRPPWRRAPHPGAGLSATGRAVDGGPERGRARRAGRRRAGPCRAGPCRAGRAASGAAWRNR